MDFEREVLEKSREIPVLVDFWAPWCGPCRALAPTLERVAERFRDRLVLVKVNVDEYPELAARYGVRGVPALKLFLEGQVADEVVGALPEELLVRWLEQKLPSPHRQELERAKELLARGLREEAERVLEGIDDDEARFLLAKLHLFRDPEAAEGLLSEIEEPKWLAESQHLKELIRFLKQTQEELSEGGAKPFVLEALEALRREEIATALSRLLEALAEDRRYGEELPKKMLIALFGYLGDDHALVREYRQKMAQLLF